MSTSTGTVLMELWLGFLAVFEGITIYRSVSERVPTVSSDNRWKYVLLSIA